MYECDDNTSAPPPAAYRPVPPLPPVPPFNSLEDWKGELFWKAMDPIGHQYLCHILVGGKPEDIQLIFSEVKDQICALMFDRLGRYVVQSLCQVCNEEQINQLVSSVTADVDLLMVVCLNSHGSESMMDFLECLRTPKQISDVISVLQCLTPRLVNHHIGSGVISHCFDIFPVPAKETKPILDVIADIFFEMATNRIGHCLLRKLLRSNAFLLENRPGILSKIIEDVRKLSRHPIGHIYMDSLFLSSLHIKSKTQHFSCFRSNVVQCVIKLRIQDVESDIVTQLRGDFALLSMNECATHVVLTLMEEYKEKLTPQIYDEIISGPDYSRVLLDPNGKCVLKYAKKQSMKTAPLSDHHGKNVRPKKKT